MCHCDGLHCLEPPAVQVGHLMHLDRVGTGGVGRVVCLCAAGVGGFAAAEHALVQFKLLECE